MEELKLTLEQKIDLMASTNQRLIIEVETMKRLVTMISKALGITQDQFVAMVEQAADDVEEVFDQRSTGTDMDELMTEFLAAMKRGTEH
jgi:antitoxin component of MazEF toxin-antitoxin module